MALYYFFDINLPYGMIKNENNEWVLFNREYQLLGCKDHNKDTLHSIKDKNDYCVSYKELTEELLLKLSIDEPIRDKNGNIIQLCFYNGNTNPIHPQSTEEIWCRYCKKLEILSKLRDTKYADGIIPLLEN